LLGATASTRRRLPAVDGDKPARKKFKAYPIGYFHVDLAEVRTEQGKLYLLVAIDRTSKFAVVELHEKATRRVAGDFLRHVAAAVPYRIHTVLTDNGTHFTDPTGDGWTPEDIKEATVKRYYYETHDQLRQHLGDFVAAYNFARRLKTLRGLTPYEAVCKAWTEEPERFISNPHHQSMGPNI